jgi:hypothetical protein
LPHLGSVSAKDVLIQEIQRQPEAVLNEVLDFLKVLLEKRRASATTSLADSWPVGYLELFGAFAGEPWERPPQLAEETREDW